MHLVFVHGWAFDASFWDATAKLLPDYEHHRVDLGFFGRALPMQDLPKDSVLVGHSLGFVYGLTQYQTWKARIAINSFVRFVDEPEQLGCVSSVVLRNLRIRLKSNTSKALADFYSTIGTPQQSRLAPSRPPDEERLLWGLDQLRDSDISVTLEKKVAPTLVLAAKHDPLVPAPVSTALATYGECVWHPSGGHLLPLSDPHFCADHIRTFMQRQVLAA